MTVIKRGSVQIIVLALAFVASLFMPGFKEADVSEKPLVSGYNRYDNIKSVGKNAHLIRFSPESLELIYHKTLGTMFYAATDSWQNNAYIKKLQNGDEIIWPGHLKLIEAGFYPMGREKTGIFLAAAEGAGYYWLEKGIFDGYSCRLGCRIELIDGFILSVIKDLTASGGIKMRLDIDF